MSILIVCLISIHASNHYSIFNNIVLEAHQNYVVASVNHEKVVIYTDEVYFFGEKVSVQSDKEEIESLSNFHTFDFKKYMKKMNVYFCYSDALITKNSSLQRRMYEYVDMFDDPVKNVLLKVLYQFETNSNIIYSSGMHYSSVNQLMIQFFHQFISNTLSILFSSLFVSVLGILFPFKFSLFRILSGNFIKMMMNQKSKKEKVGYQYLLCLLFFPNSVHSLSFIIPFAFQLISSFIYDKKIKRILSKVLLVFIQFYFSNTCQLIPTLFFSFFRNLNSFSFILSLIQLMLPFSFIQYCDKLIRFIEDRLLSISLYGHVSILLFICFIYFFYKIIYHQKNKIFPLVIIVCFIPVQGYFNPFYTITFINVGQGDSILIQAPFQLNNTLIDIPKNKEDTVIDYLHAIGVNHIDTLVFTHGDSDHDGGREAFVKKFKVNKIIDKKENISIYKQTLFNVNHVKGDDENDNSIVLFGTVGNMNVCLMGDASIKVEKDIIQKYDHSCDILKVGHHGSQTSTDSLFIQNIEPSIAIISVGRNNYFGHPHPSVLDTLNRYQIKTYLTMDGAIQIKSFLMLQIIKTSSGEFDIILL